MGTGKYIKQLAGESAIYGISGTIQKFIGIFLLPVYTRVFAPGDYGVIALINTLVTLFTIFVVLGLDNSSARWFYDTEDIEHRKCTISSWFWCQLAVSSFAALVLFIFARRISLLLLRSEEYTILIRLAAPAIALGTFTKVVGNWLRYQRRAWTTATFFTASSLGTIGLTILFVVLYRWGLRGVFLARLLAAGITAVIVLSILKSWVTLSSFSWERLKPMLVFGLPLVPAAIASWIRISSDRLVLQMFWQETEVGLYAIAASLSSGVALFIGAFQLAWGPFAYSILHEEHSGQVYAKVLSVYAFLGALLCTGVSLFSMLLLRILTTEAYFAASSCVPFLTYSFVFSGALYIASLGSGIAKKSVPIANSILIAAGANLLLNFILIPRFGKEGAAIATMISSLIAVVYLFPVSQKNYYIPYRFGPVFICFGFSLLLLGINHFFLPGNGVFPLTLRAGMCLLFIPLAFLIGIARPYHLKRLKNALGQVFSRIHAA